MEEKLLAPAAVGSGSQIGRRGLEQRQEGKGSGYVSHVIS